MVSWEASTGRFFARSACKPFARCATPASPRSASSTTCITSERKTSLSTRSCSKRLRTSESGSFSFSVSTRRGRSDGRWRERNADLRLRQPTSSSDRLDVLADHLDSTTQSLGCVAHSIRAATPAQIRAVYDESVRRALPFHIHVEEQRKEIEECRHAYGRAPMAVILDALGRGDFTAIHCTHTADRDMEAFLAAGGRVCLCPLTEGNLGDGIPALSLPHATGGRLCLGSDSNARLSMLEDMRWLEYGQRLKGEMRGALADRDGSVAQSLLEAATIGGSRALGLEVGRIAPGAWGDFAVVNLESPSLLGVAPARLLDALIFGAGNEVIAGTFVGGRWRESGRGSLDGGRAGQHL